MPPTPYTQSLNNPFFTFGAPRFENREAQLKYDLEVALERLEALTEIPGAFAAILEVGDKHVTITTGPQTLSVRKPRAMADIEPGSVVRLTLGDANRPPAISFVVDKPPAGGPIVIVKQIIDEMYAEVFFQGQSKVVLYKATNPPSPDERVVLDMTGNVIVKNLGKGNNANAFTEDTGVTWDDIGGLDEAKAQLIEAIEEPVTHKDLYARYGKKPTRGILLYGPPGTGKTMLGKAAASALARVYGDSARRGGFLYVKGPEMLNMFVGSSEANIRQLFATAREHRARAGYPAIVFIDEADALMGKRGARSGGIEGMERTIVPQFLAEMDGLEDAGCMVLLATNRPDTLDPAVVRTGRVDTKIYVRRPTKDESAKIFNLYLKNLPLADGVKRTPLAKAAAEALFDDKHALFVLRCKDGKDQRFGMKDLASGALIAALANNVAQIALRRERDGDKGQGATTDDFRQAVHNMVDEYRTLDHAAAVQDFIEQNKLEITGIQKAS